ncbi:MAG: energy transducer TonB [Bacteroidales bacterium]|jgi:protein TonB|nr:energy transducer TonB [Bacteroidales bacterium]
MNLKLFSLKSVALFSITMLFFATVVAQNNEPIKVKKDELIQVKIVGDDAVTYQWASEPKESPTVTIRYSNVSPTQENPDEKLVQAVEISIVENCFYLKEEMEIKDVYYTVSEMPAYAEGKNELPLYIAKTARYPHAAIKDKPSGIVIVQVIIEKDGSITNPEVIAPVHPLLDAEALRVVSTLKGFTPGKLNGELVRCHYQIPVPFIVSKK